MSMRVCSTPDSGTAQKEELGALPPPQFVLKKKKVSCLASPHPPALLAVAYAFVFSLPLKIQVCGADPESIVHLNRIYSEMTSFVTFILQVSFVHRKRTKT